MSRLVRHHAKCYFVMSRLVRTSNETTKHETTKNDRALLLLAAGTKCLLGQHSYPNAATKSALSPSYDDHSTVSFRQQVRMRPTENRRRIDGWWSYWMDECAASRAQGWKAEHAFEKKRALRPRLEQVTQHQIKGGASGGMTDALNSRIAELLSL